MQLGKLKRFLVLTNLLLKVYIIFVVIYNLSKHEVNQADCRQRLFNGFDAIVAYFSARILGLHILQKINIKESHSHFEVEW